MITQVPYIAAYLLLFSGKALSLMIPSRTLRFGSATIAEGIRLSSATRMSKDESDVSKEKKVKVAIIGGGIAGLSCAAHLSKESDIFEPTVFDTGRLRPGGRCSSRLPGDKAKNRNENKDRILNRYIVDHAAQILSVVDGFDHFEAQVEQWEKDGIVKEFPNPRSVVEILKNNKDTGKSYYIRPMNINRNNSKGKEKTRMYYGVNGMGGIASAIASTPENSNNEALFKIEQDVWVSPNKGVKFIGSKKFPKWTVQTNGKNFGSYDFLVIAHNGKCADRLMSRTPAKALHSLLRTNFNSNVPSWGGKKMTLNSLYSLTIALKKDTSPISDILDSEIISAFVRNEPNLRFLSCQTRKFNTPQQNDDIEVWTLLSSPKFAKKYKGPQEALPYELVEEVTNLMIESLERSLGLEQGSIQSGMILDKRLQLWGAAVPLNNWAQDKSTVNTGFLFDAEHGVGACGDWLLDSSIAGSFESGRRLGEWLIKNKNGESVGFDGAFRASKAAGGAGIGNVR